ncbi:hypothetical protein Ciccas_003964 [Cichlidogyrus casuarinus]|uniref:Uncharacterized protein n=1 Tax=Cichlidogyrus casuarinus TaxID=1844966 RepID=A0ABD2QCU0_9PLAT
MKQKIWALPKEIRSVFRWDTRHQFHGCISHLSVDGFVYDLSAEANLARSSGQVAIVDTCAALNSGADLCGSNSFYGNQGACNTGARCIAGWQRIVCDCARQQLNGKFCNESERD